MTHYQGRQTPGMSGGGGIGGFFNFTKNLVANRRGARSEPKKIAPVRPSLTTTKQKEAEINRMIDKNYLPSGMRLAKIRQLAAQGKILNPKAARDFLHRSEAGQKLDTREGLQIFESELLQAELEATKNAVKSPIKFEYRKDAAGKHLPQTAKKLVKELYEHAAAEAREQAEDSTKLTTLQERQEHLHTIAGIIHPQTTGQSTDSAPGIRPSTPTTMPLHAVEPISPPTSRPVGTTFAAPTTGVGITGSVQPLTQSNDDLAVNLGIPVVRHHEPTVPTITSTKADEISGSAGLHFQDPKPLSQPLPSPPKVPTETSSFSTPSSDNNSHTKV